VLPDLLRVADEQRCSVCACKIRTGRGQELRLQAADSNNRRVGTDAMPCNSPAAPCTGIRAPVSSGTASLYLHITRVTFGLSKRCDMHCNAWSVPPPEAVPELQSVAALEMV
jgi:hypothetical protein